MGVFKFGPGRRKRAAVIVLGSVLAVGCAAAVFISAKPFDGDVMADTGVEVSGGMSWGPEEYSAGYLAEVGGAAVNDSGSPVYLKATLRFLDEDGQVIEDSGRESLAFSAVRCAQWEGSDVAPLSGGAQAELDALYPNVSPDFIPDSTGETMPGKRVFYLDRELQPGESAKLITHIVIPFDWEDDVLGKLGCFQVEVSYDAVVSDSFEDVSASMEAMDSEFEEHKALDASIGDGPGSESAQSFDGVYGSSEGRVIYRGGAEAGEPVSMELEYDEDGNLVEGPTVHFEVEPFY